MNISKETTKRGKRFAITLDDEKYVVSFSDKYITPGSVIVDSIPDESDPEKLNCYQYKNKKYVFDTEKWAAIGADREKAAEEQASAGEKETIKENIEALKKEIESTDYKIIKCIEYSLLNLDLPYDVKALHAERQNLRDQINEIEKTL